MTARFQDQSIIVTGAAGGIGQAAVLAFAREGGRVAAVDLPSERLDALVKQAADEGLDVFAVPTDLTSEDAVKAMVSTVVSRNGGLNVAFNNAGIHIIGTPLTETTEAAWDRVHNICLKGMFLCLKHEIPAMLASGGGAIVNTSSVGGLIATPGVGAYIAAKHGVIGLTKTAALECAPQNIRVNAICPAATETPMLSDWLVNEDARKAVAGLHPIGRWAQPEEMARAALFLASSDASFITGAAVPIDGGVTAQ